MSNSTKPSTGKLQNGSALKLAAVLIGILTGAAALGVLPKISDFYTRGEAQAAHEIQRERLEVHTAQASKDHGRIEQQHRDDIQEIKGDIKTILKEIRRNRR